MKVWEESFQQVLALDVNACVIKERILLVTVGIALARMQEVIEVNILILLNGIQTAYYIDNICSIVYEFFSFERVNLKNLCQFFLHKFYEPSLILH